MWYVSVDAVCVCMQCVACMCVLACTYVWCVSVLYSCVHVGGTNWCILYNFAVEQVAYEVLTFLVNDV